MDLFRKGYNFLQELDGPGEEEQANGHGGVEEDGDRGSFVDEDEGVPRGGSPQPEKNSTGISLWRSATGFGRQLIQELSDGTGAVDQLAEGGADDNREDDETDIGVPAPSRDASSMGCREAAAAAAEEASSATAPRMETPTEAEASAASEDASTRAYRAEPVDAADEDASATVVTTLAASGSESPAEAPAAPLPEDASATVVTTLAASGSESPAEAPAAPLPEDSAREETSVRVAEDDLPGDLWDFGDEIASQASEDRGMEATRSCVVHYIGDGDDVPTEMAEAHDDAMTPASVLPPEPNADAEAWARKDEEIQRLEADIARVRGELNEKNLMSKKSTLAYEREIAKTRSLVAASEEAAKSQSQELAAALARAAIASEEAATYSKEFACERHAAEEFRESRSRELATASARIAALQEEQHVAEAASESSSRELADAVAQIATLQADRRAVEEPSGSSSRELANAVSQIAALQAEQRVAEDASESSRLELADAVAQIATLQADRRSAEEASESSSRELATLASRLSALQASQTGAEEHAALASSTSAAQANDARAMALSGELADARARLETAEAQLARDGELREQHVARADEAAASAAERCEAMATAFGLELADARARLETAEAQSARDGELQEQHEARADEAAAAAAEASEAKAAALGRELADARARLETAEARSARKVDPQEHHCAPDEDLQASQERHRAAESEPQVLREQFAALQKRCDELTAKVEAAAAVEQRLQQENKNMENDFIEAQERWREHIRTAEKSAEEAAQLGKHEVKELKKRIDAVEVERDRAMAQLQEATASNQRFLDENKDMERELLQAQERWRGQIREAEKLAEEVRAEAGRKLQDVRDKLRASNAELEKARAAVEEAALSEQRLREENHDMEKELHQAQDVWKKQIRAAEEEARKAQAECTRLESELSAEQEESGRTSVGEVELRRKVEEQLAQARVEGEQRKAELCAAAEVEAHLRRELAAADRSRAQLEERVTELAQQLERAQAAYGEAVQEVGAMSVRLDELEWGSQSKSGAEDMLRRELEAAKERQADAEKRFNEATWMRDYALQQAEEARADLHRQRGQAAQLEAEQNAAKVAEVSAAAAEVESAAGMVTAEAHAAALDALSGEHSEELRRMTARHREDLEFVRRKGDEKDRRLEVLTCERNALRLECKEQQLGAGGTASGSSRAQCKDAASVDLEEGLQFTSTLGQAKDFQGALAGFAADSDVVLRRFSRVLFVSRTTRGVFYGYLVLLHLWVWVVLHTTAAAHSASTSSLHSLSR